MDKKEMWLTVGILTCICLAVVLCGKVPETNNSQSMTQQECPPARAKLLSGADLRGTDFSFADLHNADFSNACMPRVRLFRADLSGANLRGANLQRANFCGTDLSGADLSGADLRNANFRPVVEDTIMSGTILYGADLRGADLHGVYLNSALADDTTQFDEKWQMVFEINDQGGRGYNLDGINLSNADLRQADLQQASLRQADLRWSYLNGSDFQGADLYRADLSEADLSEANLNGANLSEADMRVTNLNGASLVQADLRDADLSGANLSGAILDEADLSGAIVSVEQLSQTKSSTNITVYTYTVSPAPMQTLIEMPVSSVSKEVLAEWEAIDDDMRTRFKGVDPSRCTTCYSEESNCSQYLWTKYVTRPEWDELFPNTRFYLIGIRVLRNPESGHYRQYFVIAQQDGRRYQVGSFDELLSANGIEIADANLELIAKAFTLMTLADYIEDEILFLSWKEGNWSRDIGLNYDHKLTIWTKIQGLKVDFWFSFSQDSLEEVKWGTSKYSIGGYINESPPRIFRPCYGELRFW